MSVRRVLARVRGAGVDGPGRSSKGRLRPRRLRRLRWTLALPLLVLAVLLQADAVVKSTVMNLLAMGGEPAMPLCPMNTGATMAAASMPMAMPAATPRRGPSSDRGQPGSRAPCSYCAAAAHVPILTTAEPVQPSCAVAFTAFRSTAVHGPRGPPAVQPRARGPPPTA